MARLFSYGTLQLHKVQFEIFGRTLRGKKEVLVGYTVSEIRITDQEVIWKSGKEMHPILKYTGSQDDEVPRSVFEITAEELAIADAYEVDAYLPDQSGYMVAVRAWHVTTPNGLGPAF